MPSSIQNKILSTLTLIVTLIVPFLLVYYVSTDSYKEQYYTWRADRDATFRPPQLQKTANQILLGKNDKVEVGRTFLAYRGIEGDAIRIDLYLIELDPQQAYPKKFTIDEAKQGITIAGNRLQLISANKGFITLKILKK